MEFTRRREENIERNRKFLEEIGLGSQRIEQNLTNFESKVIKKAKKRLLETKSEPTRRSVRIMAVPTPNYKVMVSW